MAQIFLCHSIEDIDSAEVLSDRLKTNGLSIILSAQRDNLDDDLVHEKIVQTIAKCDIFVLLWNENSALSPEVMYEWTSALNLQKQLIICHFDATEVPEVLKNSQSISFEDVDWGYQLLIQQISRKYPLDLNKAREKYQNATPVPDSKPASNEDNEAIFVGTAAEPKTKNNIEIPASNELTGSGQSKPQSWEGSYKPVVTPVSPKKKLRLEIIIPAIVLIILAILVAILFVKKKQKVALFRAVPATLSEAQVIEMIKRNNFFALNWNDNADGFQNEFVIEDIDGYKVIVDENAGLTWQQNGSEKDIPQDEVDQYINSINKIRYAGFDDWRLPTLEEVMTLMEPYANLQELHIDPIFKGLWCIWTADKNEFDQRWALNFYTRPRFDVYEGVHVRACR